MQDSNTATLNVNKNLDNTKTIAGESVHALPFTMVPNAIHDHPDLSSRSKLLMWHLLRQPKGWIFHDSKIKEFLGCGRDALESSFKELRKAGYVQNIVNYDASGKVSGSKRIFENYPKFLSQVKSVDALNTRAPSHQGPLKPGHINNTNIINNTDLLITTTKDVVIPREPREPIPLSNLERQKRKKVVVSFYEKFNKAHPDKMSLKSFAELCLGRDEAYIEQKLDLTLQTPKSNPAAFFRKAMSEDYKTSPTRKSSSPNFEKIEEESRKREEEFNRWQSSVESSKKAEIEKYGRLLTVKERMQMLSTKSVEIPVEKK